MKTTLEISNYPLTEAYKAQIIDFIERMKNHSDIVVKVNTTSTHLVGDLDVVMSALNQEIKTSFEKFGKMIFVVKILKGALELY